MRVAIITASTDIYRGNEENASGEAIRELIEEAGDEIVFMRALPVDREVLSTVMTRLADGQLADLVLTTGGLCTWGLRTGGIHGCDRTSDPGHTGSYACIYDADDEACHAEPWRCRDPRRCSDRESSGEVPGG